MDYAIFGGGGNGIFCSDSITLLGFLNSALNQYFMGLINPTMNMLVGDLGKLPFIDGGEHRPKVCELVNNAVALNI